MGSRTKVALPSSLITRASSRGHPCWPPPQVFTFTGRQQLSSGLSEGAEMQCERGGQGQREQGQRAAWAGDVAGAGPAPAVFNLPRLSYPTSDSCTGPCPTRPQTPSATARWTGAGRRRGCLITPAPLGTSTPHTWLRPSSTAVRAVSGCFSNSTLLGGSAWGAAPAARLPACARQVWLTAPVAFPTPVCRRVTCPASVALGRAPLLHKPSGSCAAPPSLSCYRHNTRRRVAAWPRIAIVFPTFLLQRCIA